MKILFLGDIVGHRGRQCVARLLSGIREAEGVDLVLANAENSAGGVGTTPHMLDDLARLGIRGFTLGNHTWRKKELVHGLEGLRNVARPANYPPGVPGSGGVLVDLGDGRRVGLVNVLGRVYMEAFGCPFTAAQREIEILKQATSIVIVDMHAEATSEKVALGWYLDGQCSAVLGTHTHVQTADERVLPGGTAYITDVGMVGPVNSVIGVEKERAISKFLTGIPAEFRVAKGPACLCGVVLDVDEVTGRVRSIKRVARMDESPDE